MGLSCRLGKPSCLKTRSVLPIRLYHVISVAPGVIELCRILRLKHKGRSRVERLCYGENQVRADQSPATGSPVWTGFAAGAIESKRTRPSIGFRRGRVRGRAWPFCVLCFALDFLVACFELFFARVLGDAEVVEGVVGLGVDMLHIEGQVVADMAHAYLLASGEDLVAAVLLVPLGEGSRHVASSR